MYTSSHVVQLLLLLLGGRLGSSPVETKVNGWAVKAPSTRGSKTTLLQGPSCLVWFKVS